MSVFHSYPSAKPRHCNKELNTIKAFVIYGGYDTKIIYRMVPNNKIKNNLKQFYTTDNNKTNLKRQNISHIKVISSKVSNEFKQIGILNISVDKYNLGTISNNNKENIKLREKSGNKQDTR